MNRDPETTNRLHHLLGELLTMTRTGQIHWDRQRGSAHRYARWKGNLLILGPAEDPDQSERPRYLFITPFDSPACVEISSADEALGTAVLELVKQVEAVTEGEPPTDPFALTDDILGRLS